MESALVRVVFVVQALLLLLLLRIFMIVIIIWAFMQLAHRCRKKQSIIAVRREEEGEGVEEGGKAPLPSRNGALGRLTPDECVWQWPIPCVHSVAGPHTSHPY